MHEGAPVNGSVCRIAFTGIFMAAIDMQNDEFLTGLLQGAAAAGHYRGPSTEAA